MSNTGLQFTSNTYNKIYYYDPISNNTSWNPFNLPQDITNTMNNPSKAWKLIKSKKYKQDYYQNINFNELKQWESPRIKMSRTLKMDFEFNFPWKKTAENYKILFTWIKNQVPSISNNFYIRDLMIEFIHKKDLLFKVEFLLFDTSPDDIDVCIQLLQDLDDDGNYPLYLTKDGNITLDRPDDFAKLAWGDDADIDEIEGRTSLVSLESW